MMYKDNFKVFTRVNNDDERCKKLQSVITPWKFQSLIDEGAAMLEIDISKYDKSQG